MQLLDDLLLEQLNVLVVSVEENGTIDYVGRSVRNILGFEPEELLGYNWTRFSAEKSQSLKQSMLIAKRQLQSNPGINALSFEKKIKTKHGENKWIHWNISRNLDGSFKGIGYDISDRKKA
ncbi:MAG: PAS domain S-box protein, partial [Flavobacteriales bacterium]|nr:PAS domain S-box protein [Flavobacteriales bacterium]